VHAKSASSQEIRALLTARRGPCGDHPPPRIAEWRMSASSFISWTGATPDGRRTDALTLISAPTAERLCH
jgi:hypothetical protein